MVEHDQRSHASGGHAKVTGLLGDVDWVRLAAGEPRDRPGPAAGASETASNSVAEKALQKRYIVTLFVTYASNRIVGRSVVPRHLFPTVRL